MDRPGPLAEFLRARRGRLTPEEVGLPPSSARRRVDGLRREEVALIAGISSDYYLKLEQGRERHPSSAVLSGLARALALDADAVAHLHRLAHPALATAAAASTVSPSLVGLIASMPSIPAHVVDRYLTIIYVNRLAELLSPGFRIGNNLVELMFHPSVPRDAYWRMTARRAVAYLRSSVDPHDDGPEITALLERLNDLDAEFAVLWARHETRGPAGHPSTFSHPAVGLVELRYQTFDLPGTGGQSLGMYIPAPGGPSAEKLQLLSLLADPGLLADPSVVQPSAPQSDRVAPRKSGDTPAS
ncbi:helix-turn-helix transcriptional regulator [Galbitalea sp. SE-J8]|uniref:helix-turn-helix transcriptional regulator n=1 Tax=Galbitalea sp. SE-J8 TaxID=3054952 RepID=UPI00259D2AE7|nr:helix-turn-helix transcriptional regulator [Galbitalea sp. SE-J8]MDM4761601.1 helix-turn-helix transcriptional regulator [Galbitalea sp. SE-J8]